MWAPARRSWSQPPGRARRLPVACARAPVPRAPHPRLALHRGGRRGIRWIRSYVVAEEDGNYSGYCVYEADDPELLRRHGDAMMLPTDGIKPVVATVVASPDPEPASAS